MTEKRERGRPQTTPELKIKPRVTLGLNDNDFESVLQAVKKKGTKLSEFVRLGVMKETNETNKVK